jgi:hypothetical protein
VWLVLALAAVVLPGAAAAASPNHVYTVRPSSYLHMKGTDVYCTVLTETGGPVVACFHDPGGPTSSKRKGYAIAASDALAAVEPTGSNTPVVLKRQPSLAKLPIFGGGKAYKSIIDLGLNDVATVGGTHMAVLVTSATGGGNAIGVIYVDGNSNPVVGTYTIGISNHYVTIVQVTGPQKTKVTYRHAVY